MCINNNFSHIKTHKTCIYCSQTFFGKGASRKYKNHLKSHEIKEPKTKTKYVYSCEICDKTFDYMSYYKRHKCAKTMKFE